MMGKDSLRSKIEPTKAVVAMPNFNNICAVTTKIATPSSEWICFFSTSLMFVFTLDKYFF